MMQKTMLKLTRPQYARMLKLTHYITQSMNRRINATGLNVKELLEIALTSIEKDTTRQDTERRLIFLLRACQSPNVSKVQIERNLEAYIKELGKE